MRTAIIMFAVSLACTVIGQRNNNFRTMLITTCVFGLAAIAITLAMTGIEPKTADTNIGMMFAVAGAILAGVVCGSGIVRAMERVERRRATIRHT